MYNKATVTNTVISTLVLLCDVESKNSATKHGALLKAFNTSDTHWYSSYSYLPAWTAERQCSEQRVKK